MTPNRGTFAAHSVSRTIISSGERVEDGSGVIPARFFPDDCSWSELLVPEPVQPKPVSCSPAPHRGNDRGGLDTAVSTRCSSGLSSHNAQWSSMSRRNWQVLLPQERAYVSDAVPLRQAQFADARACARNALADLTGHDHADTVIGKGERGMPLFPHGIIGSLTHTTGFRAAVVTRTDTLKSVGLDAEVAKPLPDGVSNVVLTARDMQQITALQQHVHQHETDPQLFSAEDILETVVFSAKEALYKSWFPLSRVFLDFAQADIEVHHDGALTAFVHHDVDCGTIPRTIPGRWVVDSGYVVTSTWIT